MKILLIHPEDDPEKGPWSTLHWDLIVDLGLGGKTSYARWSRSFGCPVTSLTSLRQGFNDFRHIRDVLGMGCGRLVDKHGLDWWEIMAILLTEQMEALILLQRFAKTLSPGDEVNVSRPGLHASLLQCLLGKPAKVFPSQAKSGKGGLRHYLRISQKLSAAQMIDVLGDKYDAEYLLRGRFARKRAPSSQPVVLLPTAYINVSRTGVAYANTFPDENFLVVSTRKSGWMRDLPRNASGAWLSSYASLSDRTSENAEMQTRWRSLLDELAGIPEFEILKRLGYLESFPRRFRNGLGVRDAWRNVLDTEPVQAVLCADDSNPNTRIPLLLAAARGLPNVACHHGALDGRYIFKRTYGDVIWAKGKMEEDYLVRACGVPAERVEICAPALPANWTARGPTDQTFRPNILFISEAFDVTGGRAEDSYRDVLPPLADLALATGHTLIVKLHPSESERERTNLVRSLLSPEQQKTTRIVSGPLTDELLSTVWFGITILSTVAVECAIRGIPCFLCKWLEAWPFGYVEQFIRFGVGIGLDDPGEIEKIPEHLQQYSVNPNVRDNCWSPGNADRLRELLSSSPKAYATTTH